MRLNSRLVAIIVIVVAIAAGLAAIFYWPNLLSIAPYEATQVDEQGVKEWESLNHSGLTLFSAGRLEDARRVFESAAFFARQVYPKSRYPNGHENLATAMTNLGAAYKALNQIDLAESPYEDALAICRSLHPEGHHTVVTAANNLVSIRIAQQRFDDAEKLQIPTLAMARELCPGDHPFVAEQLNTLGLLNSAKGNLDQAVVHFTEAFEMYGRTGSPFQPGAILALNNLGAIAFEQKRFSDSENRFRKVLELRLAGNASDNPATVTAFMNLEKVYAAMGKPAEAAKYHGLAFAMQWRLWRARSMGLTSPVSSDVHNK